MKSCIHILPMNKLNGAEKMALNICKNIKEYRPIVICGGNTLKSYFEEENIESYSCSFSKGKIFSTLNTINDIIKRNNVKIIHCHDNIASIYGYVLKKLWNKNVKIISHIHSCYPWLETGGKNKVIDKIIRGRYDHNIACGKIVYNFYKNNASYLNYDNMSVLSNTVEINDFKSKDFKKIEKIKEKYNIPKDKIVLGFAGRIIKLKGLEEFIYEFEKNKERFFDCIILIVGSGNLQEYLIDLVKELGLEKYFIFTGYQKNMNKFYSLMDIFFMTSLYEGLPMVILEAMAYKTPVVSMDIGGISEVVKDNKTGYLVGSKNYSCLLEKLYELKENKENIKKLGENAYKLINSQFSINGYIDNLCCIYNEILVGELNFER